MVQAVTILHLLFPNPNVDATLPAHSTCETVAEEGHFQWPRGLRRGSATVRLLGLRVRIPPENECLSLLIVVCCQVEISRPE
jgi:hypothetical protein